MKKLLLLFATIQLSVVANAYDFTDNGIFFDLKSDGSLEVTGLASWTTRADILSDVTINGRTYRVTSIGAHAFEGRSDITYLSIPWSVTSIGEYAFIDCGSNLTVNIADPESWCQMQLGNEHSSPLSSAGKVLVHDIETTNIVIPEGVTSIGNFTFYQCRCIRSLTIPSSVTSIGSSAFEDCTGLTSLAFSEGLQSVGGSAFQGCTGLKTLTIPSTVNTISINAFANCSNITDVYCYAMNVPETHFDAFDATPTEKSTLYVPANAVETYRASWPWSDFKNVLAFVSDPSDNPKKRTIHVAVAGTLSDLISENEKYQIEELTLTGEINGDDLGFLREMAGAARIERYGLYTPTPGKLSILNISDIIIVKGGGCYYIDRQTAKSDSEFFYLKDDNILPVNVFIDCKSLISVVLPSTLKSINRSAFENCSNLSSVTIPASVTVINNNPYSGCNSLTSIMVEEGNIYFDSRNNCNAIIDNNNQLIVGCKKTIIPNSVTSIGYGAFSDCSGLTSINIPSSVKSIGDHAFHGCSGLTSVSIGNNVTSIGNLAFLSCIGLTSVTIPKSVTSIGYGAFSDCNGLTSVNISDLSAWCVIAFSDYCFSIPYHIYLNGEEIKDLTIPSDIASIGNSTFSYCSGLTSVSIPNSVTSIGNLAFNSCSGLTSVTIGNGVTSIGNLAFNNCSGLTSVTIGNSVTSIGYEAFKNCSGLTSVTIGNSVTSIGYEAFNNCSGLTSVTIGNSVTSIGSSAFSNCNGLTSVTIPNSVTSIGYYAFWSCDGLTTIVSEIENPFKIDGQVFYSNEKNIYSIATLIVPKGKKAAYQATEGWNKFANIFEVGDVNGDNKINNDDLNAIVSYIMGKTPAIFNVKVADLNNDGKVNVADVTILVKIIKNIQ